MLTCSFNESGLSKNLNLFRSQHAVSFNIWKYGILLDQIVEEVIKDAAWSIPGANPNFRASYMSQLRHNMYQPHDSHTTCLPHAVRKKCYELRPRPAANILNPWIGDLSGEKTKGRRSFWRFFLGLALAKEQNKNSALQHESTEKQDIKLLLWNSRWKVGKICA